MRTINKLLGIAFAAMLLLTIKPTKTQAQPGAQVSYQTFYDELSPYGTWVDDPDYGDVWVPDVEDGFQPYATRGHWVLTEYGNTWVSDYEWGWAPFHYGRWRFDDYYGWEWIPGSEWGPAWVNWRTGGEYYAWAPLGPRVSIDISFGNDYTVPDDYWICAPRMYINNPRIYDYYLPRNRVGIVIRNTTIINNVYVSNNRRFVSGPGSRDIERYTGRPVRVYGLNNSSRPGTTVIQNNTVNVYRPNIIRNNRGDDRPRPTRVVDANAYRNQNPNGGIANRSNGATIRHENSSRLAQTARNTQPDNNNNGVVRVNRPGVNNPGNGNNNGQFGNRNNGGRDNNGNPSTTNPNNGGRPVRDNSNPANPNNNRDNRNNGTVTQPATGTPANTTPNNPNNTPRGNRDNGTTTQPTTGTPANGTPNNPNNGWRGNRGNGTTAQPSPSNQPEVKPTVVPNNPNPTTTNPDNGRFNRGRNRPSTASPTTQPVQQTPAVQPQQQNQDQQAAQQRAQQEQAARQQQAQQQRQQQDQVRQQQMQQQRAQQEQARQQRQQQQPQAQPQQQRPQQQPQAQPQQQKPQSLPQQQRPQPQPQQQRPQVQREQPQPQQARPQRQEERKNDKPPM